MSNESVVSLIRYRLIRATIQISHTEATIYKCKHKMLKIQVLSSVMVQEQLINK